MTSSPCPRLYLFVINVRSGSSGQQYEEGGWGWVVLASAFATEFITFGNLKALGVLVEPIRRDLDTDLWLTGWMVSIVQALQYLAGLCWKIIWIRSPDTKCPGPNFMKLLSRNCCPANFTAQQHFARDYPDPVYST